MNYKTFRVTEQGYINIWQEIIKDKIIDTHFWGIITSPLAIHESKDKDYNLEYCIEHNIPILHNNRAGGTIVAKANDINFFYIMENNNVPDEIVKILYYLRNVKHLNADLSDSESYIGRDILIDGIYKVATFTNTCLASSNVYFSAGHISMSVDLDAIKHICLKPMNHIPKGLCEYGITQEEIINLIENDIEV